MLVGEPWSAGKVAQATAAGVILGWAYYRYGIVVAILVHIMVNYMLFALMYSIVAISGATLPALQRLTYKHVRCSKEYTCNTNSNDEKSLSLYMQMHIWMPQ